MTTLLILGGSGMTGRRLARHLLEKTRANLVLAARHIDRVLALAEQFNKDFGDQWVTALYAADPASLGWALRGIDLLPAPDMKTSQPLFAAGMFLSHLPITTYYLLFTFLP